MTPRPHHHPQQETVGADLLIDAVTLLRQCCPKNGKQTLQLLTQVLDLLDKPERTGLHGTPLDPVTDRFADVDPIRETIARYLILPDSISYALDLAVLIEQCWAYWQAVAYTERRDREK
ncbi:MAG: hypothetical protein R3E46_04200 [Sedimenticolaceae bacterium]